MYRCAMLANMQFITLKFLFGPRCPQSLKLHSCSPRVNHYMYQILNSCVPFHVRVYQFALSPFILGNLARPYGPERRVPFTSSVGHHRFCALIPVPTYFWLQIPVHSLICACTQFCTSPFMHEAICWLPEPFARPPSCTHRTAKACALTHRILGMYPLDALFYVPIRFYTRSCSCKISFVVPLSLHVHPYLM